MAVTKANIRATNKYNEKTYENVHFRLRKGEDISREEIAKVAAECGESLNQFILNSIYERIDRLHDN